MNDFEALSRAILSAPRRRYPIQIAHQAMDQVFEAEGRSPGFEILLRVMEYLNHGDPPDPGWSTREFDPLFDIRIKTAEHEFRVSRGEAWGRVIFSIHVDGKLMWHGK